MALKSILGGKKLRADAAASFNRMRADGMPASRLESAHRSHARQQELYELYLSGKGNFALAPDQSNHVKGIAIDAHDKMQRWLREQGSRYGWKQALNEAWHFDYSPGRDLVEQARARHQRAAQRKLADVKAALGRLSWAATRSRKKDAQTILGVKPTGKFDPPTKTAWRALNAAAK